MEGGKEQKVERKRLQEKERNKEKGGKTQKI